MHDLNALNVFLTLMQYHSTQRAAQKLGRSQSYVSKVLAQLRESLDDPLFTRSGEGLTPTSYAISIEPKLRTAFEEVNKALEPSEFSPAKLERITIHMVEPYLIQCGKQLIDEIRKETDALIELRAWNKLSENLIAESDVDIGLHTLSDKPQTLYQRRIHTGSAYFEGNESGEYIKMVVPGLNEQTNYYQAVRPDIDAKVIIDNQQLMDQMMNFGYTFRYHHLAPQESDLQINIEVALVMKTSHRYSPKLVWLSELIERVVRSLG